MEITERNQETEAFSAPCRNPWETMAGEIMSFCEYASGNGYSADSGTAMKIMSFLGKTGVPKRIEDMEPVLCAFIAKTRFQQEQFHALVHGFHHPQPPAPENSKKQKKARNRLQNERNRLRSLEASRDKNDEKLGGFDTRICNAEKQLASAKEKRADMKSGAAITAKQKEKAEKNAAGIRHELDSVLNSCENAKAAANLKSLFKRAASDDNGYSNKELDEMENLLPELARKSVTKKHASEIISFLNEMRKCITKTRRANRTVKNADDAVSRAESEIRNAKKAKEDAERNLDRIRKEISAAIETVKKLEESTSHRPEFIDTGNRAVQSEYTGDIILTDKNFKNLTREEKRMVYDYIRENARQFRTRMTHNIADTARRKVDIRRTIKLACGTDGIPLRLCMQRPNRQRAKLVMILDVSGSCKKASELMLTFMHYMQAAFPGGCHTYAFTNVLYDISDFMKAGNAEAATEAVLSAIPRAGAYSNYEKPLRDMYENHMGEITKDTLVFFIGDARNNRNQSGEEFLKAICRKAKHSYWLETDPEEKWDQGDSIISTYIPYLSACRSVLSPLGLVNFLMDVK